MWSWQDPNASSGVSIRHGANQEWFVSKMQDRLLHLLGQSWRGVGRAIGCLALLPARIGSQTQGHHGLELMCLELFSELMTLRATVGPLLVGLVCSRVHGCGFLGAGCTRNIGGMVPVCVGVESCWLATCSSEVCKISGKGLGRDIGTLFLRSLSLCWRRRHDPNQIYGESSLP